MAGVLADPSHIAQAGGVNLHRYGLAEDVQQHHGSVLGQLAAAQQGQAASVALAHQVLYACKDLSATSGAVDMILSSAAAGPVGLRLCVLDPVVNSPNPATFATPLHGVAQLANATTFNRPATALT